nr:dapper homolog 1 [Vulpes vulpes]
MCSFFFSVFLPNQNCLRRRDAGLLNQLQELDKQISDLRLDVEKTSEEHLETDSRPSSGFYELSDGASGSLSNSSNSVFSECLSSCHSSTCFCSPLEATLTISDGCPKSADLIGWLESKEGHCEDQASGAVCHSSSTSQFNSLGVIADVNPKYQCDLVSKNGNDVYRYPSPLHAVAVQSPMFLLCLTGSPLREEERLGNHASDICVGSELDAMKTDTSLPSPGSLWSAPHPSSSKRMDGYILSLVQKKTHPVRTNKPRTSVSADPTKGLLRNGSVCVRVTGGVSQGNSGNLKNSKQVLLPSGGIPSLDNGTFSPLKQWSKESKAEPLESKRLLSPPEACSPGAATELPSKHLPRNAKPAAQDHARCPTAATGESPRDGVQVPAASPKESPGRGPAPPQENRVVQPLRKVSQKGGLQPAPAAAPSAAAPSAAPAAAPSAAPAAPPSSAFAPEERPALDFKSEGSSSQSLEEGPPERCPRRAACSRPLLQRPLLQRPLRPLLQRPLRPLLRRRLQLSRRRSGRRWISRHKRAESRRWRSAAEVSLEEALRRSRRRREHVGLFPAAVPLPYSSPYAYVASDSEYSAECESLFHSTVLDTSEDERSNYTTNCFGDSESSVSDGDFAGDSTSSSDSEESGGLIWSQFVQTLPIQAVAAPDLHSNPTKTFVKIKASHNLKKKILRFRSGSLKLMTTV